MGYEINIEVNAFQLSFGNMSFGGGCGLFINFKNEKIKKALQEEDPELINAIKIAFSNHELLNAQHMMNEFEHYYLQGQGWDALMQNYSFTGLSEFKKKAELILDNEPYCSEYQCKTAKTILETLNGNPPPLIHPEKTPEEKAKSSFDRKKPKLRTKLVIRDGYKCDICAKDNEDSLCITQKETDGINYELSNLTLRCRSCMNKCKNKK